MEVFRIIKSEWIHSQKTAVLKVPSAIVHEEANVVLNPQHPDYSQIQAGVAQLFKRKLLYLILVSKVSFSGGNDDKTL